MKVIVNESRAENVEVGSLVTTYQGNLVLVTSLGYSNSRYFEGICLESKTGKRVGGRGSYPQSGATLFTGSVTLSNGD